MKTEANYGSEHLVLLFSRMAKTYGPVNLLSSFGFSHLWRKACVEALAVQPGHSCADLMAGMAESSILIAHSTRGSSTIHAVDFCPTMTAKAHEITTRLKISGISLQTADVLGLAGDKVYDRICASFGIKTLDAEGQAVFAAVLYRLLKSDGKAALVEIHVPSFSLLRWPYLFYIRHVIPLIGRLYLGDPDCYRSLAIYTERFAERNIMGESLKKQGFSLTIQPLFFGCAQLFIAEKST